MTELRTNGYSFGCNHYYCKDCFEEYIKTAINDGQPFKSCPTEGCKEILAPKLCFDLFGQNEEIYSKYKRYLLQNIVDTSYNVNLFFILAKSFFSYYGAQEWNARIQSNY